MLNRLIDNFMGIKNKTLAVWSILKLKEKILIF